MNINEFLIVIHVLKKIENKIGHGERYRDNYGQKVVFFFFPNIFLKLMDELCRPHTLGLNVELSV